MDNSMPSQIENSETRSAFSRKESRLTVSFFILFIIALAATLIFAYRYYQLRNTQTTNVSGLKQEIEQEMVVKTEEKLPLATISQWEIVDSEISGLSGGDMIVPATTVSINVPANWIVTKNIDLEKRCFSIAISEKDSPAQLTLKSICGSWSGEQLTVPSGAILIDDYFEYGSDVETYLSSLYRIDIGNLSYYGKATRWPEVNGNVGYQQPIAKESFEKVIIVPSALGLNIAHHHRPMIVVAAELSYDNNSSNAELIKLIADKIVHSMRITKAVYPD